MFTIITGEDSNGSAIESTNSQIYSEGLNWDAVGNKTK